MDGLMARAAYMRLTSRSVASSGRVLTTTAKKVKEKQDIYPAS